MSVVEKRESGLRVALVVAAGAGSGSPSSTINPEWLRASVVAGPVTTHDVAITDG